MTYPAGGGGATKVNLMKYRTTARRSRWDHPLRPLPGPSEYARGGHTHEVHPGTWKRGRASEPRGSGHHLDCRALAGCRARALEAEAPSRLPHRSLSKRAIRQCCFSYHGPEVRVPAIPLAPTLLSTTSATFSTHNRPPGWARTATCAMHISPEKAPPSERPSGHTCSSKRAVSRQHMHTARYAEHRQHQGPVLHGPPQTHAARSCWASRPKKHPCACAT